MEAAPENIDLRVEYLDAKRHDEAEDRDALERLLSHKYETERPDLILVSDDPAFEFIAERHERLFAGVPVVFCGLNSPESASANLPKVFTGFHERMTINETLDLVLRMHPEARPLYLFTDSTASSGAVEAWMRNALAERQVEFTFLGGSDTPLEELLEKLRSIPAHSAVLGTTYLRDGAGVFYHPDEVMPRISEASAAPLYSAGHSFTGRGAIGGMTVPPDRMGAEAAVRGLAILRGVEPSSFPVATTGAAQYTFDRRQLQRWEIDESRLPAGSVVLFRVRSLYEENQLLVWSGAVFLLFQSGVIALLLLNIRRRRRAETQQAEAEERMRQALKMEAVGRLAGGVAHDFNNLLTVILGHAELAADDLKMGSVSEQSVAQVRTAGLRARDLVRQLLAFGRQQALDLCTVDLNEVVSEFGPLLKSSLGEDVELLVDLSSGPTLVHADAAQLERVLVNLAVNARDAMPDGGRFVIETRRESGEPWGMIVVSDSGRGMDLETQAHIFEPFYTTKGVSEGGGLGLAVAHGIVEQHSGRIEVKSEPGAGSVFSIRLPLASGSDPARETREALTESTRGSGETILLVEDQQEVRELARRILQQAGYAVCTPLGSLQAEQLFEQREGRVDLLLTDVVMPGLDGPSLLRSLRAKRPELKALFMSGYSDVVVARRGGAQSDVELIEKPFTSDALLRRVRQVLNRESS